MITSRRFSTWVLIHLFSAVTLCCCLVSAQEPTPQAPPPDTNNQANSDQSSDDSESIEHPVAVVSTAPPIRQTTSAGFLMPSISPLRWGPLYVGYAQFSQIFDQGSSFNGQGSFQNAASQFLTAIVFDKQFRKARVAVQYVPRLTVLNGQVLGDFVNQDTGVSVVFQLTPRLSFNLSDHFVYYKSKDAFADIFLSSDPGSGSTLQRDFIQAPGSWLTESITGAFTYALSVRTRIAITPDYIYATTSTQATPGLFSTVNEYGISVSVTHDLTSRSSVSVLYSDQTDLFAGGSSDFQTFQGGYSRSFNGGWSLSGNFGVTASSYQTGRTWSESGSGSAIKRFKRSTASIAYFRGHILSGYISKQFSDRIDASYRQYVGRRWTLGGGVGYLRDVVTANGIWGKYGEGQVGFGLTSTVSLFGSYVHVWQKGDNTIVFSGTTNYLRCGVQWVPHQPAHR